MVTDASFDTLTETLESEGLHGAAEALVQRLRQDRRYAELFEALKLKARIELGLPPVQTTPLDPHAATTSIPEEVQDQLDKKLIDACREVGTALMRSGRISEGWMYMRAVGDNRAAADALADVEVNQENLDTLLGLWIHEGIDVGRGTRMSLEKRGTCNTITILESVVAMQGRKEQQAAVKELVKHVYAELRDNLANDLTRRGKIVATPPEARSISKMLSENPGLLKDGAYHLDTSHLASTVRFARVLDSEPEIRLAMELAEYGRQLHAQYQYPGEEPFADLYPMSLAFFRALVGEHVDAALRLFLQKAESLDPQEHGTVGIETYADLLTRVGRASEALDFLIRRMPAGQRPFGIAPSLIDLATGTGRFDAMLSHARQRGDLLGYAAALFQAEGLKAQAQA